MREDDDGRGRPFAKRAPELEVEGAGAVLCRRNGGRTEQQQPTSSRELTESRSASSPGSTEGMKG
jgi:hypothetical protein